MKKFQTNIRIVFFFPNIDNYEKFVHNKLFEENQMGRDEFLLMHI